MEYEDKRADTLRQGCKGQQKQLVEQWCAGAAKATYVGDNVVLCRVLHDFLMYVDGRDISISPHLIMRGMWEPWVTYAIARHVRPGWRCVDVGANMGYYTLLLAALVTEHGHVLAVEPQESAMHLLECMVSVNGFGERVSRMQVGASSRHYPAVIEVPGNLHGGARLLDLANDIVPAEVEVRSSGENRNTVECIPLDDVCSEEKWDFIKIDVEGMEHQVLEGLKKTLDAQEEVTVAVEVTPFHWEDGKLQAFVAELNSRGFSVGMVERSQGHIVDVDIDALPTGEGQWEMLWLKK